MPLPNPHSIPRLFLLSIVSFPGFEFAGYFFLFFSTLQTRYFHLIPPFSLPPRSFPLRKRMFLAFEILYEFFKRFLQGTPPLGAFPETFPPVRRFFPLLGKGMYWCQIDLSSTDVPFSLRLFGAADIIGGVGTPPVRRLPLTHSR